MFDNNLSDRSIDILRHHTFRDIFKERGMVGSEVSKEGGLPFGDLIHSDLTQQTVDTGAAKYKKLKVVRKILTSGS